MFRLSRFVILVSSIGVLLAGCQSGSGGSAGSSGGASSSTNSTATFASVKPIFDQKCITCHTGAGAKEGVDLSSHETIMKGGRPGPIVVSGDPAKSLLIQVLRGKDGKPLMPPKNPLSEEQIKTVEAWIAAGAPG